MSRDSCVLGWVTGLLPRAVWDSMAVGVAVAAHVRVAAVSAPAPRGLIQVKAHRLGTTLLQIGPGTPAKLLVVPDL